MMIGIGQILIISVFAVVAIALLAFLIVLGVKVVKALNVVIERGSVPQGGTARKPDNG